MAATIGSKVKRKLYATLRERHGDDCHWCGAPMCFETKETPASVTIEHLVPKFEGGTNEQKNLRLAHWSCNQDRHATPKKWPRRAHHDFPASKVFA